VVPIPGSHVPERGKFSTPESKLLIQKKYQAIQYSARKCTHDNRTDSASTRDGASPG
jgi:hypothetical protein